MPAYPLDVSFGLLGHRVAPQRHWRPPSAVPARQAKKWQVSNCRRAIKNILKFPLLAASDTSTASPEPPTLAGNAWQRAWWAGNVTPLALCSPHGQHFWSLYFHPPTLSFLVGGWKSLRYLYFHPHDKKRKQICFLFYLFKKNMLSRRQWSCRVADSRRLFPKIKNGPV